jgi:hypothetical protein
MRVHGDNVAPLDQQFFRHGWLSPAQGGGMLLKSDLILSLPCRFSAVQYLIRPI